MALAFPLQPAQFMNLLPIRSMTFEPPETVEVSRTRGGEILRAERGARLWQGRIELDEMSPAEANRVLPLINLLRAGGTFLITDPLHARPQSDPAGTVAAASPVIGTAEGREMTISSLPAGYALRRGDLVSWTYGTNPLRYALHEVVTDMVVADASGLAAGIEVSPPIRPWGSLEGRAVRLITPWCKALIVPKSVSSGRRRNGGRVADVAFDFIQTLR